MPLAGDISIPASEHKFVLVGDSIFVFLLNALSVLLRIKFRPILSVAKLILEVPFTCLCKEN